MVPGVYYGDVTLDREVGSELLGSEGWTGSKRQGEGEGMARGMRARQAEGAAAAVAWVEGEGAVGECRIREVRAEPSRGEAAEMGEGTD